MAAMDGSPGDIAEIENLELGIGGLPTRLRRLCVGSVDSCVGRQHKGGPNSRGRQQLLIGPWLHGGNKNSPKVNELCEFTGLICSLLV